MTRFRLQRPHGGVWLIVEVWHLRIATVGHRLFIDWRMSELGNRWRIVIGRAPIWTPLGDPAVKRPLPWGWEWIYYPKGLEKK